MTYFNKIPTTPHYAILTRETVHIPGDERSRTNPGHGYPAEDREYVNYEVFPTRDAWLNKIKEYENPRYGNKVDYKAIEVKPAKIEVSVTVGAT